MTRGGGLTFLFTDIEGSTQLVDLLGSSYGLVLRIHRRVVGSCVEAEGGSEFGTEGDAVFYAFTDAARALRAAVAAQRRIETYEWPDGVVLRVRMGLASGRVAVSGGEYVGLPVHEAARVCAAAHGGQILCSATTAEVLGGEDVEGELVDLGAYELRSIGPRQLLQLCAPGLEQDFPPPRGDTTRAGGTQVGIWMRDRGAPVTAEPGVSFRSLADGVETEVRKASSGEPGSFRLVVRRNGVIEEEYDGLTVGGVSDAAAVVNGHSRLVRVQPEN